MFWWVSREHVFQWKTTVLIFPCFPSSPFLTPPQPSSRHPHKTGTVSGNHKVLPNHTLPFCPVYHSPPPPPLPPLSPPSYLFPFRLLTCEINNIWGRSYHVNDIPLTGHVLERNLHGGLEEMLSRLEGTSRGQRDLHGMLDMQAMDKRHCSGRLDGQVNLWQPRQAMDRCCRSRECWNGYGGGGGGGTRTRKTLFYKDCSLGSERERELELENVILQGL